MTDGLDYFIKKKVYIVLKNRRVYSGIIESIENIGNGVIWITLTDKFNNRVTIASEEVELIEEEREKEDGLNRY